MAWRSAAGVRLAVQAAGLGLALCGAALAQGLATLAVAVAVAGVFVSPLITTAYLIADETAAPEARVQAGAWVNTAVNAGGTAGTAAAGVLVGWLPAGVCFAVTGGVMMLTALAVARRATGRAKGYGKSRTPEVTR
ncbi:MFS transporter [Streptomyces sp. bgisy027]|uniref:MFS transporter n=1 Tax=Streptomyces sp. bgisy027 TaxID=3413770 RepID=UPI003D7247C4